MEMLKEMSMEELEKQAMKEIAEEYGLELIDENDDVLIGFITAESLLEAIKNNSGCAIYSNNKVMYLEPKQALLYLHNKINDDALCTIENDGLFIITTRTEEIMIEF